MQPFVMSLIPSPRGLNMLFNRAPHFFFWVINHAKLFREKKKIKMWKQQNVTPGCVQRCVRGTQVDTQVGQRKRKIRNIPLFPCHAWPLCTYLLDYVPWIDASENENQLQRWCCCASVLSRRARPVGTDAKGLSHRRAFKSARLVVDKHSSLEAFS